MIKAMYIFIGVAFVAAMASLFLIERAAAPIDTPVATPDPVAVMCTADAMQCPDGSYVGRTGPSCEFVCPTAATEKRARLDSPLPNAVITSPLSLSGQAGGWYFEGSFPVELVDATGTVIAQTPAQANGDWMTSEFVPFTATLTFVNPYTIGDPESEKNGKIILRKDNPSGLPENDDFIEIPVRFAP
jgi:Immunoglobulin-like domain of bacterial spore germination